MRPIQDILEDLDKATEQRVPRHFRGTHIRLLLELQEALRPPDIVGGKPRSSGWEKFEKEWLVEHPACSACGGTEACQVHHIKPFAQHPELELCKSNVMTLCMAPYKLCHFIFGHAGSWTGINPHVVEDAADHLLRVQHRYD